MRLLADRSTGGLGQITVERAPVAKMPPARGDALRDEEGQAPSLFSHCANPRCATGWIQLWRNRRVPNFEGRWACSPECMKALVASAVRREAAACEAGASVHEHRVPLGLMLVEQGCLTEDQLRTALEGQRQAGNGNGERLRLGKWLVVNGLLSEMTLIRILAAQWSCPVLSLDGFLAEETASAVPPFLAEACGVVPVRLVQRKLLYVAFAGRVDRSLSYAVERMTGLRVTSGLVRDAEFAAAQRRYREVPAPGMRFLETATAAALARSATKLIEREKPADARLVRIHEYYWLRLWKRSRGAAPLPGVGEVEDILCTVGHRFADSP